MVGSLEATRITGKDKESRFMTKLRSDFLISSIRLEEGSRFEPRTGLEGSTQSECKNSHGIWNRRKCEYIDSHWD